MRENRIMRTLLITLTVLLTVTLCIPGTAEAASAKVVKSVSLKIGNKIYYNEVGHYENRVEVIDHKCTICGILDSQL